ncbi:MAG TPA: response regulator transcription factor [Puia sp.]|uniref:response regulator transcription factor n=1 Tax=Puia sp. TaxID=2045100 RepID=UPI002CC7397C|nr:response regulator transcription factor [Puia sp.]HVU94392.1 response regulator transcription factor [Puia sp.]
MKILIADDHEVVRQGLERIFQREFPGAHIECVADGADIVKKVMQSEWDLVISDLSMPSKTGLEALEDIKKHYPKLPVLILTMHPEEQYALRALKAGASGYLSKSMDAAELITAARRALMGRKYITPSLAERLSEMVNGPTAELPHQLLSNREFEVMKLLAKGLSLIEIGQRLAVTPTTISTYRSRILHKMNLANNSELTRYAIVHQLID